jgi:hypothetical protein
MSHATIVRHTSAPRAVAEQVIQNRGSYQVAPVVGRDDDHGRTQPGLRHLRRGHLRAARGTSSRVSTAPVGRGGPDRHHRPTDLRRTGHDVPPDCILMVSWCLESRIPFEVERRRPEVEHRTAPRIPPTGKTSPDFHDFSLAV